METTATKTVRYNVAVHKNLPLAQGETLNQFSDALRSAACKHVIQSLNLDKTKSGCYVVEIMSSTVVVEAWQQEASPSYKFYGMKFTRSKEGAFEISGLTEVERVTTYRQKVAATTITKALFAESVGDEAWVVKSLFAGVI